MKRTLRGIMINEKENEQGSVYMKKVWGLVFVSLSLLVSGTVYGELSQDSSRLSEEYSEQTTESSYKEKELEETATEDMTTETTALLEETSLNKRSSNKVNRVQGNKSYLVLPSELDTIWNAELTELVTLEETLSTRIVITKDKLQKGEETYLSIYTLDDVFMGYLLDTDIKTSQTLIEKREVISIIMSIVVPEPKIYKEPLTDLRGDSSKFIDKTVQALSMVQLIDGSSYYEIADGKGNPQGYISADDVVIVENEQGKYRSLGDYVTVSSQKGNLWQNFQWQKKKATKDVFEQTFLAKGKYEHLNGSTYYSLYNSQDVWQGYINASAVTTSKGKKGVPSPYNQYVTIQKDTYQMYENFNWVRLGTTKDQLNKTFLGTDRYRHFNGQSYIGLNDGQGNFQGYVNQKAVSEAQGPQGKYQHFGKYVTVRGQNTVTTSNFKGTLKEKNASIRNKTFLAKGRYQHVDGTVYYSLYNYKNQWQGYVKSTEVSLAKGAEGTYQTYNRYVTLTSNKGNLWTNFRWSNKRNLASYKDKTYIAKGIYNHYNGSNYLSLYDQKNNWIGYMNQSLLTVTDGAQGAYQSYGKDIIVSSKNYVIWNNFNWDERAKGSQYVNKTFKAKGKYVHFNGSTYYSLYDSKGKWQGYINAKGTKLASTHPEKMKKVQQLLNRKYNSPNYGIYVTSLVDSKSTASMNGNRRMTAASTGKLPAMYYTQKMINEKKIKPTDKFLYTDAINQMSMYSYMRGGAGILQGRPYGGYYSIDQILHWTAKYSDNQGANFLGYYGANRYSPAMRRDVSSVIGRTWDSPFSISPKENALLISAMYQQGGAVLGYMSNTIFDDQRIPKYLPVRVAHKIGDVYSYQHDVAIIYTKEPYVLSIMTQNGVGYETISRMSKDIYDIMK